MTLRHVAPLGLWLLGHAVCYKHAAPLGLKADAATCRPVGALVIWCMPPVYKHAAPLGLKADAATCRPVGALVTRACRRAINMSPLWGFGYLVYVAVL